MCAIILCIVQSFSWSSFLPSVVCLVFHCDDSKELPLPILASNKATVFLH